ncbi:MAG: MFS transporter [Pyrinomonadaceae bacterium]
MAEVENIIEDDLSPPSLWRRYARLPRNILALSLVSLLNDASSEIIYPLLPFFLTLTLGASPFAIGLIEGAAESASSLFKLAAGYFSDKLAKRKSAIFAGYALSSVMRPFLGFAASWTQVLGLRLADRLGKGIRSAPRDALVADSVAPEKRGMAFGFHRAMDHAGAVIGPLIAFFLLYAFAADHQNPTADEYSKVFLVASLPALLALIVIAFFVKEKSSKSIKSPKPEVQTPKLEEISNVKFDANFKRFLFVLALFTLANSSDAFLLLQAQQAGIAPVYIPLLWTFLHIVKVSSSLIGGDLSDRIGRKKLIFAGWVLYALVYAGFAFVTTPIAAWVLFGIYGLYFGLTEGAEKALVTDLVPPNKRGTAFGWYHLAFGIAVFPASLLTGGIWKFYGAKAAFLFCAIVAMIAAILLLTVKPKTNFNKTTKPNI